MEKVEVNLKGDGVQELIIREGDAPKNPIDRVPVKFTGTIDSVIDYYKKRSVDFTPEEKKRTHVEYSIDEGRLDLIINEDHYLGDKITGVIQMNKDVQDFGINQEVYRSPEEIAKFIKLKRYMFPDIAKFNELYNSLMNFNAKVTSNVSHNSDDRGNAKLSFDRLVKTSLPETFMIESEIIKGEPASKIVIDIGIEPTSTSTRVWLISNELVLLDRQLKRAIIKRATDVMNEHPILER